MTVRNPAPALTFTRPPCPICRDTVDVDTDVDWYTCGTCLANWDMDGAFQCWDEPEAPQCQSHSPYGRRCLRVSGHISAHTDGKARWLPWPTK